MLVAQVRLGGHLGRGDKQAALRCMRVAFVTATGSALVVCLFLYTHGSRIAQLYSTETHTQAFVVMGIPALCCGVITLVMSTASSYALTAMSRTSEVAAVQMISVWMVLVPIGLYYGLMANNDVSGFFGIMWSLPLSYGSKAILCFALLATTDWNAEIKRTAARHIQ